MLRGATELAQLAAYLPLTGGTLTGPLAFSGTTNNGLRVNNLTTAQKNALTALAGNIVYDTDLTKMQFYAGGAWRGFVRDDIGTISASLAIGGATIGANVLAATGTAIITNTSDNQLTLNATGQYSTLLFANGGSTKANFFWDNSANSVVFGTTVAAGTLSFRSGANAIALSINNAQAATLAGTLSVNGATIGANGLAVTGTVLTSSSITTGTPSGGTAGAWKFGIRVAATVVLDTTQYIQLDVGGTLYKVAIAS